ncbi:ABC transporter D family member 1 [Raphanus sativus]|nr:ABC transporter D family member 1 [Raphanus sativus]
MPSLQLLQLTERGRSLVASRRKSILLAAGIVAAGGAFYLKSRISSPRLDSSRGRSGGDGEALEKRRGNNKNAKKATPKKKGGGLKSLQVLTAILLSQMGKMGARDLLALLATVVFRTALSNRLAKVQGFLFRAAFLRRAPLFLRLISENIFLCFMLSTTHATSKYITGALSLRFRKILTKLIHSHYFENMVYYKISHVDGRITHRSSELPAMYQDSPQS